MGAWKSGSTIMVDGTGNTLSSITSDINDITWIEESPAGTFTIKQKWLQIQLDGELTIGDAGDYSVQETLQFDATAHNQCRFYIYGTVFFYGDVEIWGDDDNSHYQTWYWYGKAYIRGNATQYPVFHSVYQINKYMFRSGIQQDINLNMIDADYFKITTPFNNAVRTLVWNQVVHIGTNAQIKHYTYDGITPGWGYGFYHLTTHFQNDDMSKMLIEDCLFKNANYGFYVQCGTIYVKNTTLELCTWGGGCVGGTQGFDNRIYKAQGVVDFGAQGQYFSFLDGCTFVSNSAGDMLVNQGACVLFRDCNFGHATVNIQTEQGAKILIWSGNTFAATNYINNLGLYDSVCYWVNALDITVKTAGDVPIEDAWVLIKQKDGKEFYTFKTDSNGKPMTMQALAGKILLTWKEQLDEIGSSFDLWSDSGNSTYHEIWVYKEGYTPEKYTKTMSTDQTFDVTLQQTGAPDARIEKLPLVAKMNPVGSIKGRMSKT